MNVARLDLSRSLGHITTLERQGASTPPPTVPCPKFEWTLRRS